MANVSLKDLTIAETYDLLLVRNNSWSANGNEISLMNDSGTIQPSGFYIDPTNDRIGIGVPAPKNLLHIGHAALTSLGASAECGLVIAQVAGSRTAGNLTQIGLGAHSNDNCPVAIGGREVSEGGPYGNDAFFIATRNSDSDVAPTERMCVLPSGNVGIGVVAPQANLHVNDNVAASEDAGTLLLSNYDESFADTQTLGSLQFGGTRNNTHWGVGAMIQGEAAEAWDADSEYGANLIFRTCPIGEASTIQRMTILNSGYVGIDALEATAPQYPFHVRYAPNENPVCLIENFLDSVDDNDCVLELSFSGVNDASDGHYIQFADGNTAELTGTIDADSGIATNNTVSDYRLKENISLITGGLEKVNALKPSYFNYKSYPDKVHQGFIAHEVVEAGIEYAVRGEKDAMKIDKRISSPSYGEEVIKSQQFAIANIIPQMVSAIQELSAKVEALENA